MKQWAIAVGINQYQFFQPLSYAQHDAQALQTFLLQHVGLMPDQCVLLTDSSPPTGNKATQPTQANILTWLDLLADQYVQPRDIVWFFFSGYGLCWHGRDYLMPIDGNPAHLDRTAISLESLFSRFKRTPVETILVLDVSRSQGTVSNEMVGTQTAQLAGMLGMPTILSCQPGQFSHETSALGHGFFTAALLDSLYQERTMTLAQLDQRLRDRLPALTQQYWRPLQHPLIICPSEKRQQPILLPPQPGAQIWHTPPSQSQGLVNQIGAKQPVAPGRVSSGATVISPDMPRSQQSDPAINNGVSRNGASHNGTGYTPMPATASGVTGNAAMVLTNGAGNRTVPPSPYPPIPMSAESPSNGYSSLSPDGNGAQGNQPNSPPPVPPSTPVEAVVPEPVDDENEHSWQQSLLWGGVTATALLLAAGVYWRNFAPLSRNSLSINQSPPQGNVTNPSGVNNPTTATRSLTPSTAIDLSSTPPAPNQVPRPQPSAPASEKPSVATPPNAITNVPGGITTGVKRPVLPSPTSIQGADQSGSANRNAPGSEAKRVNRGTTAASRTPANNTPKVTSPKKPVRVVTRTRKEINSNQASPYWYGIQEARTIKPTNPQYQQAQQDIVKWSREIWAIAKWRANQKQFDTAIMAAALVPADQTIHADAQKAIDRWCPSLSRQRAISASQRKQAKAVCQRT